MITKEQVLDALHECKDPEMPMVSIVELGLVYDVIIDGDFVDINMTLTTPGCGMSNFIANDAKTKIESIDGVKEVTVNIVWDPPWTAERITDDAKKRLGFA